MRVFIFMGCCKMEAPPKGPHAFYMIWTGTNPSNPILFWAGTKSQEGFALLSNFSSSVGTSANASRIWLTGVPVNVPIEVPGRVAPHLLVDTIYRPLSVGVPMMSEGTYTGTDFYLLYYIGPEGNRLARLSDTLEDLREFIGILTKLGEARVANKGRMLVPYCLKFPVGSMLNMSFDLNYFDLNSQEKIYL